MIAYFRCACSSKDRLQIKELKRQGYEVRIVKYSQDLANEARAYGLKLPFAVENGKARSLRG